jgi:hypothetical protein
MFHGALGQILTLWDLLRRQPALYDNARNSAETKLDREPESNWASADDDYSFSIQAHGGFW